MKFLKRWALAVAIIAVVIALAGAGLLVLIWMVAVLPDKWQAPAIIAFFVMAFGAVLAAVTS